MKELPQLIEEFCGSQEVLRLAYLDNHQYPRVVPLWFVVIDGEYFVGTKVESAKWKAVQRNRKVGWVIDGGERGSYKGASMCGLAEEVTDPDARTFIYEVLAVKYFGSTYHPKFIYFYGQVDDERTVYLRLTPERGISWGDE